MSGPEFIIAIIVIGCVTSLIKTWLDKKENVGPGAESFNRLAQAFMQHKKEMQQRVENLEAIVTDEELGENKFTQIETSDNEDSLTNDLKEKDRVRS